MTNVFHALAILRAWASAKWLNAGIAIGVGAIGMAPSSAHAIGFFTPNCSDKSVSQYLVKVFGSLFSQCGGAAGPFEKAIGILNAGALTIGGMLAAYTLVAGTMQTAHDGEMLGKRWSSMWLPIRTALGVGLIVPLSSGYCVAQLVIGWFILQGVGLADSVWTTYLTNFATVQGMAPKAMLPNVGDLARGILESEICMAAYNNIIVVGGSQALDPTPMSAQSPSAGTRTYGISGGKECGAVVFDQTSTSAYTGMGDFTVQADVTPLSAVQTAHMNAVPALEAALQPIANQVVAAVSNHGPTPQIQTALVNASVAYQTSVTSAASAVFGNTNALQTLVSSATSDGWYMAGAWFMKAAQMQDAVNQVVSHVPASVAPNTGALTHVSGDMAAYFDRAQGLMREQGTLSSSADINAVNAVDSVGNSNNPLQKGAQALSNMVFAGTAQWMFQIDPNRSALMSVKDFGDHLMVGSEAGLVLGVGIYSASQVVADNEAGGISRKALNWATLGASSVISKAAGSAGTMVSYLIIAVAMAIFGFATSISVYLPLAPFLLYFGAFIGWLVLCGEAIIAAPLWAVMHLTPSGDDIMGGARGGYMLILALLLRPVLLVLGFVFALIAMDPIVLGFNAIFFPAFKLAMSGSMIGLPTSIAMVMIYFGTMVYLFHKVFGLIHVIPDQLMRWIGHSGGGELGQAASGMSKQGEASAGGLSKHVATMQQQTVQGLMIANQAQQGAASRATGTRDNYGGAQMQEKVAMNKADIAQATASGGAATPAEKLEALGANMAAVDALDSAEASRMKVARLDRADPGSPAQERAKADYSAKREAMMQRGEGVSAGLANAAASAEAALATTPANQQPQAVESAKAAYASAASAYSMLARNEQDPAMREEKQKTADELSQKAASLVAPPPQAPTDGGDGSNA